jgi:hypothetical protein
MQRSICRYQTLTTRLRSFAWVKRLELRRTYLPEDEALPTSA